MALSGSSENVGDHECDAIHPVLRWIAASSLRMLYQRLALILCNNFSDQLSEWFKTLQIAENICGSAGAQWPPHVQYGKEHLRDPIRGIYARHDLEAGQALSDENVYLAIPLQKGQISYKEFMPGTKILSPISGDDPILFSNIDGPYREGSNLSMEIERRGEDTKPTEASREIFRIV